MIDDHDADFLELLERLETEFVAQEVQEAFYDAMDQTSRRISFAKESKCKEILKKRSGPAMTKVKNQIKEARSKERMRTVSYYLCDRCDARIINPKDGYIIHGNIYTADPSCRGGLIGNAFPKPAKDDTICIGDIKETVFCERCFLSALELGA